MLDKPLWVRSSHPPSSGMTEFGLWAEEGKEMSSAR